MSEVEPQHFHSHSHVDVPISIKHKKIAVVIVGLVIAMMSIAIVLTFPSSSAVNKVSEATKKVIDFSDSQYAAVVDGFEVRTCDGQETLPAKDQNKCRYVLFDVKQRKVLPSEGIPCVKNQPFLKDSTKDLRYCYQQSFDAFGPLSPELSLGSRVVLSYRNSEGIDAKFRYQYADQDRRPVLIMIFTLFLLAVILFGAWRGLLAVAGLLVSLVIIAIYILPALLTGENGMVVALAGGSAVAFAALYLAHGFKTSTHIAFLSSIGAVLTIAFLAQMFFTIGRFSGFVSEESSYLAASGSGVDIKGLLIAGVILASLGALDDMTVTQVSAVSEMHNARPDYRFAQLWKSAVRIGRDHVASTVNTLALAYVGTSLAVMILFVISKQQLQWIANSEAIAVQIVGALVGSVGLIIAVPLSTALCAFVVSQSGEQGHDHESHENCDHDHDHEEDLGSKS